MTVIGAEPFAVHHKLWTPGLTGEPEPGHGALLGVQLQPRELARLNYEAGWNDAFALAVSVMVELAESQGYTRAIHVNLDGTRDRGLWQLNSIHKSITDEIAYDPVRATEAAFGLYVAHGSDFGDWAAYLSDVYLHDSYLGRANQGVGNFLADWLLRQPVKDWNDKLYAHRFTTPVLNFQHRLSGCLNHLEDGAALLGWQAASRERVQAVRVELGKGVTAARAALPQS